MIAFILSALGLILSLSVHHLNVPFILGVGKPLPIIFVQNVLLNFGVTMHDLIGSLSFAAASPRRLFILLRYILIKGFSISVSEDIM